MNTQNHLERAEQLLLQWEDKSIRQGVDQFDLEIGAADLAVIVKILVDAQWGYLVAITGLDPGIETGSLWVLYHFAEGAAIVTLRVIVSREHPEVPTIRNLVPLAGIYEQELVEVLGVSITGVASSGRLFLPDDWPDDVYPLRKDFQMA